MSINSEIQRFLNDVDSKIFRRGLDYYRSGMVECIDWDGSHATAEVCGSEEDPYLVEVDFSEDSEVEDWSCDCPYEWGPVCKHIVAVLLALREREPRKTPKKTAMNAAKRKAVVEHLVGRAQKEQLAALVLEHCQEDKRFRCQVLLELGDSGELEFAKELVQETIRANTHRGYIDMEGCDDICADLDGILDKARLRIKRGQWESALEITQFVLLMGVKMSGEVGSSSGSLSWTVHAAMETVTLALSSLVESGEDRAKWVRCLLETVQDPVFESWTDWRYELLRRTAVLANEQNEDAFYETLANLSDRRWEAFQDGPRYDEQDKQIRYYVIRHAHGAEEGRAYLERNLAVDEFRLMLAREYIEEGNYAAAETLCQQRLAKEEQGRSQQFPSQWDLLLYEIYRAWGEREKQIWQSRRLALMGAEGFYLITKGLLAEDGRWQETYPEFLAELKAARPAYEYMEILKLEGELPLLMEQVRLNPESVFRYGDVLAPQYREEVCKLCTAVIRKEAEQAGNRREYQALCGLIQSLAEFGGRARKKTMVAELQKKYPRRPALMDELGRI